MPKIKNEQPKKKTSVKRVLYFIILFLGTFSITLSFAELANSVQMSNSSSNRREAKWNIELTNISKAELKGNAKVVNDPISNNLGLTEFVVTFAKPGDSIKYTFDVKNSGTIDAKIAEFSKGNPSCKFSQTDSDTRNDATKNADSTLVCGNLEYKVIYEDGKNVAVGDTIVAKGTKKVVVIVTYKENSKESTGPVNVTVPVLTILFK